MHLTLDEITSLHVEITNKCNAACPMCGRNIFGGKTRNLRGLSEWSLADISHVITPNLTSLEEIEFCGTHGDPIVAKNLIEAVKLAKSRDVRVRIITNGSYNDTKWWTELLSYLGKNDTVVFGIDGIETNHLYRIHTNIELVMANLKLCCASPIRVDWDFLVFKHNEHELEKCKNLAHELGIRRFRIRRTPRFSDIYPYPAVNNKNQITHYLELPENPELRHPDIDGLSQMVGQHDGLDENKVQTMIAAIESRTTPIVTEEQPYFSWKPETITCLYRKEKKIYVNSRLEVFPCCYISDEYETVKNKYVHQLQYPIGELSLRHNTWEEILNHPFYAHELGASLSQNNTISRCIKSCGVFDREKNQNINIRF